MAVLLFDGAWNAERIEWEISRLKGEVEATHLHIKRLEEALFMKKQNM